MKKTTIILILSVLILGSLLLLNSKEFSFKNNLSSNKQNQQQEHENPTNEHAQYTKKPKHFWRGDAISIKEVCEKWGETPFNLTTFKNASTNESVRANMTCFLLKNQKKYHGIERHKIREIFGPYSGHYFKDVIPTYLIDVAKDRDQDTWQIVFLSDRNYKIANIIVHKNCCDH